mgnify:CR=1 FL=1
MHFVRRVPRPGPGSALLPALARDPAAQRAEEQLAEHVQVSRADQPVQVRVGARVQVRVSPLATVEERHAVADLRAAFGR